MMNLLGDDAAHNGAAVLDRRGSVVGDRGEEPLLLVRERGVPVADELAELASAPAER
jgi:hypothetical protein